MTAEDVPGLVQRLRELKQRKEAIFLELLEEFAKVEPSEVEKIVQRIKQLPVELEEEIKEIIQNSRKKGEKR